ncbi:FAD-binding oxidoreductase [Actinomadura graeca]|uniref:FAD-binding oxidoreductase n=1 Tax=Actinomadura graeca TaxID=2750812 RepID=A0ABX8R2C5_9ACTN|nr:FAD-binding oxidoreductase [Actinomadura graeca]QXJ24701.1 FAD-binding oxidoreductase [Actinomadura graeca]
MRRHDFALVGGGIVGACLAEELAAAGASVTVLDAGPAAGHASRRAVGPAVPSPRHAADHDFYGWLRQASRRLREDVTRLEAEHDRFSASHPVLHVLRTGHADRLAAHVDAAGAGTWVEHERVAELAPGLRLPADRRYLLDETGLVVDGLQYLSAVRACCSALGVDWRQATTVRDIAHTGGGVELATSAGAVRSDVAVVTAGAWSATAGLAGRAVPVRPRRHQLVTLAAEAVPPLVVASTRLLVPGPADDVIVGGAEDDAGFDERCDVSGVARLLRFAAAAMPALARAAPAGFRAGLCAASATGRPLIGRVPGRERLWLATGHDGHGLLTARHSARGLTAGLTEGQWDTVPWIMCPHRALGGETCASTM